MHSVVNNLYRAMRYSANNKHRLQSYRWPLIFAGVFVGTFMVTASFALWRDAQGMNVEASLNHIASYCLSQENGAERYECVRAEVRAIFEDKGYEEAMNTLQNRLLSEPEAVGGESMCHDIVHIIGEEAVEASGNLSDVLAVCSNECGFGCFHGATLRAFQNDGTLLNNLPQICEPFAWSSEPGQMRTACNHGLGHGLADIASRDVARALMYCDKLNTVGREECATGVFMEIFDAPTLNKEHREIPDDMHAFCESLPSSYHGICLAMSGGYEYRKSGNVEQAFATCGLLEGGLAHRCASSLGSDLYFLVNANVQDAWEACAAGSIEQQRSCMAGVLTSVFVTDASGQLGVRFCRLVSEGHQEECFQEVGEKVQGIGGADERSDFCASLLPAEEVFCRQGKNEGR